MKKILLIIGGLIGAFFVIGIIATMATPEGKKSFEKGKNEAKTIVEGQKNIGQEITDELKKKNIDIQSVEFREDSGILTVKISSENALSNEQLVRDAWKALYFPYKDFQEPKIFHSMIYKEEIKLFQITGTREDIDKAVSDYTTDADKTALEVGNMDIVAPVLRQLQISGHQELMAVVNGD